MNRNQSNESTKRNHGLGARSPRSVTSTTRANAASRRALRERPSDGTDGTERTRVRAGNLPIPKSAVHDSSITTHVARVRFSQPRPARGFDRNQRRFVSIESNDVFGSIGDLTRSIDRSSRRCSFVFPRDSRARSRQNRLIRSMFARRRAVAAATRCAARSFV